MTSKGACRRKSGDRFQTLQSQPRFAKQGIITDTSGWSLVGRRRPATSVSRSGRLVLQRQDRSESAVRLAPARRAARSTCRSGLGSGFRRNFANRADIRSEIGAVAELSILSRRLVEGELDRPPGPFVGPFELTREMCALAHQMRHHGSSDSRAAIAESRSAPYCEIRASASACAVKRGVPLRDEVPRARLRLSRPSPRRLAASAPRSNFSRFNPMPARSA